MIVSGIRTAAAIAALAATLLSLMQIVWVHALPQIASWGEAIPQSGYAVYTLAREMVVVGGSY